MYIASKFTKLPRLMVLQCILLLGLLTVGCAPGAGNFSTAGRAASLADGESDAAKREPERLGLATRWGEDRGSSIVEVQFERATQQPEVVATIQYNDERGISNKLGFWERLKSAPMSIADEALRVGLVDGDGEYLRGRVADEKLYVAGAIGQRYGIKIENKSRSRIEIVASVDGLDVMNGKPASFANRGYLVESGDTFVIEGFRKSSKLVAAFRFG